MRKKVLKIIGKTALLLALFFVLSKVKIKYSYFNPLGIGLLFSLIAVKYSPLISNISYFVATVLSMQSVNCIIICSNVVAVGIITYIFIRKKRKVVSWLFVFPIAVSVIAYVWLGLGTIKQNLALTLSLGLMIIFYFVCSNFLNALIGRKLLLFNLDEKICASTMLIALAIGLNEISIAQFEMLKFVAVITILISCYCFQSSTTLLVASLLGVGRAIVCLDITYVALFTGLAIVSLAFKGSYRIFSALAIMLLEILYCVYFKVYIQLELITILPAVIACVLFLLIPKKILNLIHDNLSFKKDKIAVRSLVNRTKSGICRRMNELSQVFSEMDRVFRAMVKGVLNEEDANELLTNECISKVCASCPDKHKCMRNSNTRDVVSGLVNCGFERGKVTLLDVPQYLTAKCNKVNTIVNSVNSLLKSYKNYAQLVGNMDASRVLIADQLGGVSEILKNLAEEIRLNISFDIEQEERIKEELSYKNIVCYEAIVYEENATSKSVSLILSGAPFDKTVLEKSVSMACKNKMTVISTDTSSVANATIVYLKNSANYDIVFGVSSVSKNGALKNGDAHSLIKIDNGKYILSLCDGIGSGEKAQKISNLSISLIENFYKAGFNNDTILSSINKLLSINNEENFSSVDMCVMDFHNNLLDFIKLGATYGFVKNDNDTIVIESSGLPIGVLEEMCPHITKRYITPFDNIILLSDGISDAFDNKNDLQDFISSLTSTNPQTIADEIMDRAKDLNNGIIKDDMTVLVARIFPI